jgi:hypothetical protein
MKAGRSRRFHPVKGSLPRPGIRPKRTEKPATKDSGA